MAEKKVIRTTRYEDSAGNVVVEIIYDDFSTSSQKIPKVVAPKPEAPKAA
jgi:hypothetical protein